MLPKFEDVSTKCSLKFVCLLTLSEQILADPYYDFEIVDMKSFQDWIVYMSIIPCWHFLAKNIHN